MQSRVVQLLRVGDLLRIGPATIEASRVVGRAVHLVLNQPGHVVIGPFAPGEAETFGRLRLKVSSVSEDRCRLRLVFPVEWMLALTKREERSSHVNYTAGPQRSAGQDPCGDAGDLEDR